MSEELLLINPRRRRNARGQFTKRTARRRRRRNTISVNRRRRRRNPIAAVAANPRRRRYRRRNPVALANPRRRRRRATGYVVGSRRIRRRKLNPRMLSPRGILNALIPAGMGAAGAVALDLAMNYVPLPAQFQTPLWKNVARIVGAFGLGYVAAFALGREKARQVTLGALTVASYTVIRDLVSQNFPQLGLSGAESYDMSDLRMGYLSPAPMLTSAAQQSGMGAYMRGSMPTPAPGVGAYMRDSLDTVNSMAGVVNDGM